MRFIDVGRSSRLRSRFDTVPPGMYPSVKMRINLKYLSKGFVGSPFWPETESVRVAIASRRQPEHDSGFNVERESGEKRRTREQGD